MHKSGVDAVVPALDDIRPLGRSEAAETNLGSLGKCLALVSGGALLLGGLRRRSLAMMLGGGALCYRGAAGFRLRQRALDGNASGLQIEESLTLHKPVAEVYPRWRGIENLPSLMSHLESVTPTSGKKSHWVALPCAWSGTRKSSTRKKIEKSRGARFQVQTSSIRAWCCFIPRRRETPPR